MINILKNNLKLLEKINNLSKKQAATFADIQYLKKRIKEFEIEWQNFQKFLFNTREIDPCSTEQLRFIYRKSWDIWSDLNSLINKVEEFIGLVSKNYTPPCPEAALEYKIGCRETPLYLEKIAEEMEPLEQLKVKQAFFRHGKIYGIERIANGFIAYNKSNDILIFNEDLNIIDKLVFTINRPYNPEAFGCTIYKKFNSEERVFFSGSDEEAKIFYFDYLKKQAYEVLEKELKPVYPDDIYYWQDEEIILYIENVFYGVNPYSKKMRIILESEVEEKMPDFYHCLIESLDYDVIRAYPEQYTFIYRDVENLEIGIRNTKENTLDTVEFYNREVYDVKIHGDYIMFIEEMRIDVRKGKHKRTLILPDPGHFFKRAEFFEQDGKLYVAILDETNTLGVSSSIAFYEIADSFKKMVADDLWK